MSFPTVEVRVDWRRVGFSQVANDGFETDTSGWLVTAGINAAGTSITRTAGGYAGSWCGRLITTGSANSGGNYDFGTTTFTSGRTYRARLAMKVAGGSAGVAIKLGSLGTPADRATSPETSTMSWTVYTLDWTPSSNRTDVELAIVSPSGGSTVDLDHVEVYELKDDISSLVTQLSWGRGTSLVAGGATIGSAVLVVRNDDHRFDPANTGGPYGTNVRLNREVWVRSTWNGSVQGHFYGTIERVALRPAEKLAELHCVDMLDQLARGETSVVASITRSIRTFRGLVLDDVGISAAQRDMDSSDPEGMIPLTEADQASPLATLELLNEATGTVHFVRPVASASVRCQYVTRSRPWIVTGAPVQTFDAAAVSAGGVEYDMADVINVMRVTPVQRGMAGTQVVWTSERVPFSVGAGLTKTIWAHYADPTFSQALSYTATGSPTITLTAFSRSGKITVTAGVSAALVTSLSVEGEPYEAADQEAAEVRDAPSVTTYMVRLPMPHRRGYRGRPSFVLRSRRTPSTVDLYDEREAELASDYIVSTAHAEGLASWWVYRYAEPPIRPSILVRSNDPTTQVTRDLLDRIALTSTSLSLSAQPLIILGLTTTVGPGGEWTTTYTTEAVPAPQVWFTIGGTADEGIGGTGILAY